MLEQKEEWRDGLEEAEESFPLFSSTDKLLTNEKTK